MIFAATEKKQTHKAHGRFPLFFRLFSLLFALLLLFPNPSQAITKAALLSKLFGSLELYIAPQGTTALPLDVKPDHSFSNIVRSAVKYGIILPNQAFSPDAAATKSEALYLALCSMGWRFEAGLSQKIGGLQEFAGSGDPILFMAAEMVPQAPAALLSGGDEPLSDENVKALLAWVTLCRRSVVWNRVFSYAGTDLILYRQGVGTPGTNKTTAMRQPPLYLAAIAVAPSRVDQSIVFAEPLGRPQLPLSEIARSVNAIGAVNGGFFYGGRPIGSLMQNGMPVGKPYPERSAIGWTSSGQAHFGSGVMKTSIAAPSGKVEISSYNTPPAEGTASLYVATVTPTASGLHPDTLEIYVDNGVVFSKRLASESDHILPKTGFMIAARGRSKELLNELAEGSTIALEKEWANTTYSDFSHLIQAGPMLLSNGVAVTASESFNSSITEKQHPRTFVGVDASNRIIWAVMDGRDPMHSMGGTIAETRWIAKSLGMINALNLDGGGSSTLWWRGIIANKPSDGKERPVPYGITMHSK